MNDTKKLLVGFIGLCTSLLCAADQTEIPTTPGARWTIDCIQARVNGTNILASDLALPQVDQDLGPMNLTQAIRKELLVQRAQRTHMAPSTLDVERQIVASKMENGMTSMPNDEFEQQLTEMTGLTLPQYKDQIWRTMAAENVKRAEIVDKIVVSSQEVEAYYKANPVYTPIEFKIRIATISDDAHENKTLEELLKENVLSWDDVGWISSDAVSSEYNFVKKMTKNSYSQPRMIHGTMTVVHVQDIKDKRLLTLDERYHQIAAHLTEERKNELVGGFQASLKEKATIVIPPQIGHTRPPQES